MNARGVLKAASCAAIIFALAFVGCSDPTSKLDSKLNDQAHGFGAGPGFTNGPQGIVGTLVNAGSFSLTGEQTFSTTGTSNDVALNATSSIFRYTGGGVATITGFAGGTTGRFLVVINASSSNSTLALSHQTGSAAANQITGTLSVGVSLSAGGGALLKYDASTSKWLVVLVNTLTFNSTLNATAGVLFAGRGDTASLSGTVNDLTHASTFRVRILASAATTITGISSGSGTVGRFYWLHNVSAFNVTLANEGAGSSANNRFANPQSVDLVMPPGASAFMWWDATLSRWSVTPGVGCYSQASNTGLGNPAGLMVAGRYYAWPDGNGSTTNSTAGNGNLRCASRYVPNAVTITRVAVEITVAGEAGSKERLCIYGDSGASSPGSLIVDAGQVDGTVVGVSEITGLSASVGPGWYWGCSAAQSAPTTQPTVRTGNGWAGNVGIDTVGVAGVASSYLQSSVTGACPSTFSGANSGAFPARLWTKV